MARESELELSPEPEGVPRTDLGNVQQIQLASAVLANVFIRDVNCFQEDLVVIHEAVAYVQIPLEILLDIPRLVAPRIVANTSEKIIAPVVGKAYLEAILIVERDEVSRVAEPANRKLRRERLGRQSAYAVGIEQRSTEIIERDTTVDKCRVGDKTETGITRAK